MRSLYLRIYLTVVLALALFAAASGWLVQRHLDEQRVRAESVVRDRMSAWAELLQRSLPPPQAETAEQQQALNEWSQRLRVPMALDDADGRRVAASDSFVRRELDNPAGSGRLLAIRLDDGRTLWVTRPGAMRAARGLPGEAGRSGPAAGPGGPGGPPEFGVPWFGIRALPDGVGLAALLVVLFLAVAAGAFPVVRRLTRRLEALKQGVEAFGAGALHQRVAEDGGDEVAAVGASFNRAAGRIEALLRSHQSLLANASHELRSPLARLKMAVSMLEDVAQPQRAALKREIGTNIAELDALVEEVLLASRLDAAAPMQPFEAVPLLALVAEEAARVGASVHADEAAAGQPVQGDERLLRRALRNLLENARRHGGSEIEVTVASLPHEGGSAALVRVCDRGPGVPEVYRERIFEAFFRLPGQAEREGGVGLGLALVRQIASRHGGSVCCLPRDGGGSCFELRLPRAPV
jgi:signal transduction histidine kinase